MKPKKRAIAVLILFVALTFVMTYPLVFHLGTGLRGLGDPLLNTWIMGWNIQKIARADFHDYFDGNIYYPHKRTLAYSEVLLPQSLAGLPVMLLSRNPILAHNVVFLLAILTSGLGMYWLAFYLSRSGLAAVAAGIIFAFCPYMVAHFFQIQILTAAGIPLSFLFLHKYFEKNKPGDFVLFGLFFLLQSLSNGYYALFLTLFAGLYILIKSISTRMIGRASFWIRMTVFSVCVLAVSGPVFYQYSRIQKEMGFGRDIGAFAGLKSFLATPPSNRLYGDWSKPFRKPEGELFPGFGAFLLAAAGLGWGLNKNKKRAEQAGRDEVHTGRGDKAAVRFYTLILGLAFLLALGPGGPFVLLHRYVPGFNGIRAASRFHIFIMFSLAVLAAFGLRNLISLFRGRAVKSVASAAVCLILLAEYASFPVPLADFPSGEKSIPEVYRWLSSRPDPQTAVLELPVPQMGTGIGRLESPRVFYSIFHGHPIVNGYSGFIPPLYVEISRRWRELPVAQNIADLKELSVGLIILHEELFSADDFVRLQTALAALTPDVRLINRFGEAHVYEVETSVVVPSDSADRAAASYLREIRRSGWSAKSSVNPDRAGLALDGDAGSRWDTGPQQGGETFEIDLGEARPVRFLSLGLADKARDYPRGGRVDISLDGISWEEAARLQDRPLAIRDFLRPMEMAFEIVLPGAPARYIRIINTGKNPSAYWSIYEIQAFE